MNKLTANNLKQALWETLNEIKTNVIMPAEADAIASQAREILRTIKVQLQIAAQGKRNLPNDVYEFSEDVEQIKPKVHKYAKTENI